ncbi:amino acid adenylation domain-containing protein [Limnoraphis robusta]|uniref:Amino acid adenylation domain-containing protein n=1 Tax=Limnoraphis robusta CCNP1315 TaxID=3110306 RepID=A0ABU5TSS4_9CYAN|nr:amino acid adenylation domain-containing protein [Limnoraphis robusta]MEA5517931.1 amino acid adenylation domain-containing protein [Limnoraphis robusta CCNP1315]MEA5543728.1 amino acid adenylation domain-containing protein [Limnoraphis robusta CCNP1324]
MNQKNIEDIYPLSPMQQGMLFHSLLAPESGAYIVQSCYEVQGSLNPIAFEQAWQQVINRNSILRTAFVWENLEKPLQVVGREVKAVTLYQDWQHLTLEQHKTQLNFFLKTQRKQGFNLSKAPLMSFNLIQVQDDIYQFIWTYHHLLLDGWSVPLIVKEFITLYETIIQGQNLPLEKPRPYRDYIAWLKQQDLSNAQTFWSQILQGLTTPTTISRQTDRFNSQNQNYQEQHLQLSEEITEKILSFAKQNKLTVNTLVQAAWAIILSYYSGENDVIFGATYSGRPTNLMNAEQIVGLFINTLPVRIYIDGKETLLQWIKQLQSQQIEAQQYQYIPLVDIHRLSEIPRNLPLFESLVIFENYPVDATLKKSLNNLKIKNVSTQEQTNYPLTLYAVSDSQLSLKLVYDSEHFNSVTITQIVEYLNTLLFSIITNPQQKLYQLSLLSQSEQHKLLVDWNKTQTTFEKLACIHQLFETQAQQTPDAIAIVDSHQQLSYQQLNIIANQLAHYLQKQGVKPEQTVGICLERSCEMVIALLAVLKVGATYIPLDPAYPKDRLNFIIENAQISLILTQTSLNSLRLSVENILNIDEQWSIITKQKADNLYNNIALENLAYIIYTSGSTGQPKGVQISHRALSNFLLGINQTLNGSPSDVLLSVTSLSFDIAALELYLPLIVGARVIIANQKTTTYSQQLQQQINQLNITIMQGTPATWQMLILGGWTGKHNLKILSGGEALDPKLAQQLTQNSQQLFNLYGPTETTIWSSIYQVKNQENSDKNSTVFIGRPLANTEFYILDNNLQTVPIGVPGELYIGGVGVARGYFNRADLTAERFLPNPFKNTSERLYKTGDLARYLNDGNVEYLGRLDSQVKLRGFRIELGEIEAVLKQHPQVQQAVVAVNSQAEEKRLIAYIVLANKLELNVTMLREFLAEKLPGYMIPSAFFMLDALPLTPNGKIDRRALPIPEQIRPQLEATYVMPKTEIEKTIAQIWQKALKLENIGIHDNFFDLGGHSLLMVRVHSQLRAAFSSDIPLVEMFRYPTIHALADYFNHSRLESLSSHQLEDRTEQLTVGKKRLSQLRQRKAFRDNDKRQNN